MAYVVRPIEFGTLSAQGSEKSERWAVAWLKRQRRSHKPARALRTHTSLDSSLMTPPDSWVTHGPGSATSASSPEGKMEKKSISLYFYSPLSWAQLQVVHSFTVGPSWMQRWLRYCLLCARRHSGCRPQHHRAWAPGARAGCFPGPAASARRVWLLVAAPTDEPLQESESRPRILAPSMPSPMTTMPSWVWYWLIVLHPLNLFVNFAS